MHKATKGTITSKWNNRKTCTIRVPIVLKKEILEYAHALDSDEPTSGKVALKLINHYLNKEPSDKREANPKYNSPRWYHFFKFKEWLLKAQTKHS